MMDWNEKLALLLFGLSATALGRDPSAAGLGALMKNAVDAEREKEIRERFDMACSWLGAATDGVPLPPAGSERAPAIEWAKCPELTHPISSARIKLESVPSPDRISGAILAVLDEAVSRSAGDAKRQALWIWRWLPERLATVADGLGCEWFRYPADVRCPAIPLWQHVGLLAALATAAPEPVLLTVEIPALDIGQGIRATDVRMAAAIRSLLSWAAARSVAEQLGPDNVIDPWLAHQPLADRWLMEQGAMLDGETPAMGEEPWLGFPGRFTALVPSARVEELAALAVQAAKSAWSELGEIVRDKLACATPAAQLDRAVWERQIGAAIEPTWTAVPIEEDSTGVGALLPSRDISAYEKTIKARRDAVGSEQPGKGVFLGLWSEAARAATEARGNSRLGFMDEPEPRCTMCGERVALYSGSATTEGQDKFWALVRGAGEPWQGSVGDAERLCAVCSVRRYGPHLVGNHCLWGAMRQGPSPTEIAVAPVIERLRSKSSDAWDRLVGLASSGAPESLLECEDRRREIKSKPKQIQTVVEEIRAAIGRPILAYTALLMLSGEAPLSIVTNPAEAKEAATVRSVLHTEIPAQLQRLRARWRDVLDTAVLPGLGRRLATSEASCSFVRGTAKRVLADVHGRILGTMGDDCVALAPFGGALAAARRLREGYRRTFVELDSEASGRVWRTIHLGPAATASCVIGISRCTEPVPIMVRRCRRLMTGPVRELVGRDALAILMRLENDREMVFACRWDDVGESMDQLVAAMRRAEDLPGLMCSLLRAGPALSNVELDRSRSETRVALVRAILERELDQMPDGELETVARSVLTVIDRNGAAGWDGEGQHCMDGIHIAAFLAQGV